MVAVILLGTLFAGSFILGSMIKMGTIGYLTGYQGLQSEFDSVRFKDYWYDSEHLGPNRNYKLWPDKRASAGEFFDHLNLDPDHSSEYLPNLAASQQPIVVDETVEPKRWLWRYLVNEETESGENATHRWTITWQNYKEFQILRYRAEWAINLWLSGPAGEAYPSDDRAWHDAQVWIKLEPKQFLYFKDNPDRVFFAPALIQVLNVEWFSYVDDKDREAKDPEISRYQDLIPKSEGETLGIFYTRGATPINMEEKVLQYQDKLLDPQIFRDDYYVRISLLQFKPNSWWNDIFHLTGWSWRYPSVKIKFLVHIFVVGEWTVRLEKGETVELKPHEPTTSPPTPWDKWDAFWTGVANWLNNPFNKIAIGLFAFMAIAVILLVFTPLGTVAARIVLRKGLGK